MVNIGATLCSNRLLLCIYYVSICTTSLLYECFFPLIIFSCGDVWWTACSIWFRIIKRTWVIRWDRILLLREEIVCAGNLACLLYAGKANICEAFKRFSSSKLKIIIIVNKCLLLYFTSSLLWRCSYTFWRYKWKLSFKI